MSFGLVFCVGLYCLDRDWSLWVGQYFFKMIYGVEFIADLL